MLLWAACFFTSFESSAWIVCERGVLVRAEANHCCQQPAYLGPGACWGWNHWDMGVVHYSLGVSKVGAAVCILRGSQKMGWSKGGRKKVSKKKSSGKEAENTDAGQAGSALDLWNPC